MPRALHRMPLELGLKLNINQLLHEGLIESGYMTPLRNYRWANPDGVVTAHAQMAADMTKGSMEGYPAGYGDIRIVADWIEQTIQLIARPRYFGGRQWYFVCPRTNQAASILWSPPGERFFAGKNSWGNRVAYLSQYYAQGARAHYNRTKLCERVGGPGASKDWDLPPKPKHMRWRTYERLSNRFDKYGREAGVLPTEYRIDGDVI